MSSLKSPGNQFQTPESSPDTTEADLRVLERSLDKFRQSLDETVQSFNLHSDYFSQVDDSVFQQIEEIQESSHQTQPTQVIDQLRPPIQNPLQVRPLNQVSTESLSVENLIRQFETYSNNNNVRASYFTSGLPLFRIRRSLSKSLSSQGRLSSSSIINMGDNG